MLKLLDSVLTLTVFTWGFVVLAHEMHSHLYGFRCLLLLSCFAMCVSAGVTHLFEALLHHCHIWVKLIVKPRLSHGLLQVIVEKQGVQDDLFLKPENYSM